MKKRVICIHNGVLVSDKKKGTYIENEDVYLLHACRKQKNKTEMTDKNIVITRAKELGKLLNKSFI